MVEKENGVASCPLTSMVRTHISVPKYIYMHVHSCMSSQLLSIESESSGRAAVFFVTSGDLSSPSNSIITAKKQLVQ